MANRFATARRRVACTERNTADDELYVHYRDNRGFDAFECGQWQANHAAMIIQVLGLEAGDELLDVGCAGGANVEAWLRMGLDAWGVDISRYMIEMTPLASGRLVCAPAWELDRFEDGQFDCVHSNQVFEHVPEERCDAMMGEITRVLRKGGVLFAGLVVGEPPEELPPEEDSTHINIKPWPWWFGLTDRAGLKHRPEYETALRCHDWWQEHPFEFAVWRKG